MVSQTTTAITTPMIVKFTTSIRVAHAGFCIGFSPFAYRVLDQSFAPLVTGFQPWVVSSQPPAHNLNPHFS